MLVCVATLINASVVQAGEYSLRFCIAVFVVVDVVVVENLNQAQIYI